MVTDIDLILQDTNFLKELFYNRLRTTHIRVTALDLKESPVEQIEGQITSGSINIDGNSAVSRTCNFTLVTKDINLTSFYWYVSNKIKVEIGLDNLVNSLYPSIIWFPQGVFAITSFTSSKSSNSWTISLSGRDKYCLLNGDMGGTIPASVTFDTIEDEVADKVFQKVKIPIPTIIREMLHSYAGEPYYNIIINDLDEELPVELISYKGQTPLYFIRKYGAVEGDSSLAYKNFTADGTIEITDQNKQVLTFDDPDFKYFEANQIEPVVQGKDDLTVFQNGSSEYVVRKISPGEVIGYKPTDLTYPKELISSVGDTVASVLDQIVSMLGTYEYFYNLKGQFVFQKKKVYTQTLESTVNVFTGQVDNGLTSNFYSFDFQGLDLITSISVQNSVNNIKNDVSVFGERETASGAKVPIHYRLAVDKKPIEYTSVDIYLGDVESLSYFVKNPSCQKHTLYSTASGVNSFAPIDFLDGYQYKKNRFYIKESNNNFILADGEYDKTKQYYYPTALYGLDWRELIYQMAYDCQKYSLLDNFLIKVKENNPTSCPEGYTGYEQYYIDIFSFWRDIYVPGHLTGYVKISSAERKKTIDLTTTDYSFNLNHFIPVLVRLSSNELFNVNTGASSLILSSKYDVTKKIYALKGQNLYPYYQAIDLTMTGFENFGIFEKAKNTDEKALLYTVEYTPKTIDNIISQKINPTSIYIKIKSANPVLLQDIPWTRELMQAQNIDGFYYETDENDDLETSFCSIQDLNYGKISNINIDELNTKKNNIQNLLVANNNHQNLRTFLSEQKKDIEKQAATNKTTEAQNEIDRLTQLINSFNNSTTVANQKYKQKYIDLLVENLDKITEQCSSLALINTKIKALKKIYIQTKNDNSSTLKLNIQKVDNTDNKAFYNWLLPKDKRVDVSTQTEDIVYYKAQKINKTNYKITDYSSLNFWLDFVGEGSELEEYAVYSIGDRIKAISDSNIESIKFAETPDLWFVSSDLTADTIVKYNKSSKIFANMPDSLNSLLVISSQNAKNSAENRAKTLLNESIQCSEQITLNTIPIYSIQPNTKIHIIDEKHHLNGDYIVTRVSVPLAYNGTMAITAYRVQKEILI